MKGKSVKLITIPKSDVESLETTIEALENE